MSKEEFQKQYFGSFEQWGVNTYEKVDQALALYNHWLELNESNDGPRHICVPRSKSKPVEQVIAFSFEVTMQQMHERRVQLNQTKQNWEDEFKILYHSLLCDPEGWGSVVREMFLDNQRQVSFIELV